jgi:hypothetical protein
MVLLLLAALVPIREMPLTGRYDRIDQYNGRVYLAQHFTKSIVCYPDSGSPEIIAVTDAEDYRIDGFRVSPFMIYINTGRVLIRFLPASGWTDTLYRAEDISSFILTPEEEVVVGDRSANALIFFDYQRQLKFIKNQIPVKDLQYAQGKLYALTDWSLLVFDKFGNPLREHAVPENLDRLFAVDSLLFLFSPGRDYFYMFDGQWHRIGLPYDLSDLTVDGPDLIVLGNRGSALYFYPLSDGRVP